MYIANTKIKTILHNYFLDSISVAKNPINYEMSNIAYKRRTYTGGAGEQSSRSINLHNNELNGLLQQQWL